MNINDHDAGFRGLRVNQTINPHALAHQLDRRGANVFHVDSITRSEAGEEVISLSLPHGQGAIQIRLTTPPKEPPAPVPLAVDDLWCHYLDSRDFHPETPDGLRRTMERLLEGVEAEGRPWRVDEFRKECRTIEAAHRWI